MDQIVIRGARTHNLKDINLTIPRDKFVVITGLSGSGKSSLAFDTLYAEGQRRYVESLSAYARQFLSMMEKPDIDHIEGLSPAISIEQKSTSHNPRSTVGTITEIYDYLRLLFARVGEPFCPEHNLKLEAQTISQMVDKVMTLSIDTRIMVLAPIVRERKGEHLHVFDELKTSGFIRARVDGILCEIEYPPELEKNKKHSIDVVVDRLKVANGIEQRLAESFETAVQMAEGIAVVSKIDEENDDEMLFSALFACPKCGHSISELEPKLFSFNSPAGACSTCDGLGQKQFFDESKLITDNCLSLGEGAIRGWDRRNIWYFQMLNSLADHYSFKLDIPFKKLSKKHQKIILRGSGEEPISFKYINDKGNTLNELCPSEPAEILGLNDVPQAGDDIIVVENESRAREVSEYRQGLKNKEKTTILSRANSMENILKNIKSGEKKLLNLIVKADALGSKEAIVNSLENIGNEEVDVQILLSGVGGITETDVGLAASNEAFIIGFNVRSDLQAKKLAKQHNINVKYYSIIYEIFDEVRGLLSGMLPPMEKEKFLGLAEIKKVFKISKLGKVAGCFVTEGTIKRNSKIRLLRDSVVIHSGDLETLKRHSDEAKDVAQGNECGISIKDFNDIQVNDVIESYEIESTPRKLEEK